MLNTENLRHTTNAATPDLSHDAMRMGGNKMMAFNAMQKARYARDVMLSNDDCLVDIQPALDEINESIRMLKKQLAVLNALEDLSRKFCMEMK